MKHILQSLRSALLLSLPLLVGLGASPDASAKFVDGGHYCYETLREYQTRVADLKIDGIDLDKSVVLVGVVKDASKWLVPGSNEDANAAKKYIENDDYYQYSGTLDIPATVTNDGKTYNVVAIGGCVFYKNTKLTGVTFHTGLIKIRPRAFEGCTGLTSVALPSTLTQVSGNGFYGCKNLTQVTVPEGVQMFSTNSFTNTGLTSLVLPRTFYNVGNNTFTNCKNLDWIAMGGNSNFAVFDKGFASCSGIKNLLLLGDAPGRISTVDNGNFTEATLYVPNTTKENLKKYTDSGFKHVVEIVKDIKFTSPSGAKRDETTTIKVDGKDEAGCHVAYYGDELGQELNLTNWNGSAITADVSFERYPNGRIPAGTYVNEPIQLRLHGGILEGRLVTIHKSFQIKPVTLHATPFKKSYTYGEAIDFNAAKWGIQFTQSDFVAPDQWPAIDHSKIKLTLYTDAACTHQAQKKNGFYDVKTYYVKGSTGTIAEGPSKGLSDANPSYDIKWTANTVTIAKAKQQLGVGGDWQMQGAIEVYVGEDATFKLADSKTAVQYTIEDETKATVKDPTSAKLKTDADEKGTIHGVAEGKTQLKAQAQEETNYEASEAQYIDVIVKKRPSDLKWDEKDQEITVTGGGDNCIDLKAPTGRLDKTYTVVVGTDVIPLQSGVKKVTKYADVTLNADGTVTVCGTHQGAVQIRVCTEESDAMLGSCEEVTVDIKKGDIAPFPEGWITWSTEALTGTACDNLPYEAPEKHADQQPSNVDDWLFNMSISYGTKYATVGNDWEALDGGDCTLTDTHATNGASVKLTFTAFDNRKDANGNPDPLYQNKTWTRTVTINKAESDVDWDKIIDELCNNKQGTCYTGGNNGEHSITCFVDDVLPLPDPNKGITDSEKKHDVEYTSADPSVEITTTGAEPTVKPTEAGSYVVNIEVPGDDDHEGTGTKVTLNVQKRNPNVVWNPTDQTAKVGDTNVTIPTATFTPWNSNTPTKVPADDYSLPGNSANVVHYNDGAQPAVTGADFKLTADAEGDAQVAIAFNPDPRVYVDYTGKVDITVSKKDVTCTIDPSTFSGQIGEEVELPVPTTNPAGLPTTYVVDEAYAEYVELYNLPEGGAVAKLKKVTDTNKPVEGYAYAPGTSSTKDSDHAGYTITINKRQGDLNWPVESAEGVTQETIELPMPTTEYGDPSTITVDVTNGTGTATAEIDCSDGECKVVVHCGDAGEVTVCVTLPSGESVEEASKCIPVTIKQGGGELQWDVHEGQYEATCFEEFDEVPAPHSGTEGVEDSDIEIVIPELEDDEWKIENEHFVFTPEVGGQIHIFVTLPGTENYTGVEDQVVVNVKKAAPDLHWAPAEEWTEDRLTFQYTANEAGDVVTLPKAVADHPKYDQSLIRYETSDELIATIEKDAEGNPVLHLLKGDGSIVTLMAIAPETPSFEEDEKDAEGARIDTHAALEVLGATEEAEVSVRGGQIVIAGTARVSVYDASGRAVYVGQSGAVNVAAGLYVVTTGKQARLLQVK